MRPPRNKLTPYKGDRKKIAQDYGVSERTAIRWLDHYGLYKPRDNYGYKLNMKKAREIRRLYREGTSMRDIAQRYDVTFASISRVVHGVTYKEKQVADVFVIYNPL